MAYRSTRNFRQWRNDNYSTLRGQSYKNIYAFTPPQCRALLQLLVCSLIYVCSFILPLCGGSLELFLITCFFSFLLFIPYTLLLTFYTNTYTYIGLLTIRIVVNFFFFCFSFLSHRGVWAMFKRKLYSFCEAIVLKTKWKKDKRGKNTFLFIGLLRVHNCVENFIFLVCWVIRVFFLLLWFIY